MQEELIKRAKELLADGTVARVLGWKAGDLPYNPEPSYFENEDQLKNFVYNGFCGANLSKYMIEASKLEGKTLVFLKPCDTYSFNQLIKEHRVDREKAYIVGVGCKGKLDIEKIRKMGIKGIRGISGAEITGDAETLTVDTVYGEKTCAYKDAMLERCHVCKGKEHKIYDELIGESKETKDAAILKAESIEKAAHLHADKIINNAEEEYQKIREKSMQLIQQFNQYKLQLKEAASAQLQLVEGSEFDIHKPEDLDTSKAAGEETVSTQEKPEGTVKDSQADTTAESTPAEEKDNEVTVAPQPVKTEEKQIAPKTTEMSEEDRTAEILSADTIDLRDTLEAVKEQEPEVSAEEAAETAKEEAKEEKETVKIPEEPVKTVTEAAVTTPVEATPVKPIDVTFTSMDDEPKEKEEPKAMVQIEAEDKVAKNEDLVPTLDSLLQDLNMNNKEKKTDDPFEFLGSVDF
mgnify:CR=1 FL=1